METEFVTDRQWNGLVRKIFKKNVNNHGQSLSEAGISRRANSYIGEMQSDKKELIAKAGWRAAMHGAFWVGTKNSKGAKMYDPATVTADDLTAAGCSAGACEALADWIEPGDLDPTAFTAVVELAVRDHYDKAATINAIESVIDEHSKMNYEKLICKNCGNTGEYEAIAPKGIFAWCCACDSWTPQNQCLIK